MIYTPSIDVDANYRLTADGLAGNSNLLCTSGEPSPNVYEFDSGPGKVEVQIIRELGFAHTYQQTGMGMSSFPPTGDRNARRNALLSSWAERSQRPRHAVTTAIRGTLNKIHQTVNEKRTVLTLSQDTGKGAHRPARITEAAQLSRTVHCAHRELPGRGQKM